MPDLVKNKDKITKLIKSEEKLFHKTLLKGTAEINSKLSSGEKFLTKDAFHLFETFGFPIELTEEIVSEHGYTVNKDEFNKLFEEHKIKSCKKGAFPRRTVCLHSFNIHHGKQNI